MDAKYINKNYLEESIKDYDNTIVSPIRNVVSNIYYNTADRYNDLLNIINASVSGGIGLDLQLNYINSTSPVNYQNVQQVVFTTGQIGNVWCDTPDKAGTQYYDWNPSTNTLTFSSMTGIVTFNSNMLLTFKGCTSLNQNISLPNNTTDIRGTFEGCTSLNQNILIPNSVTNMNTTSYARGTFCGCTSLNQNILIPNSVTYMSATFENCRSLNQNILLPNSVTYIGGTFKNCRSLNQNILIPNSVTGMGATFENCTSLNQNILIPNSVTSMGGAFADCTSLNQNILIPNSVTGMFRTFKNCTSLNQNILIPNSVTNMADEDDGDGTFMGCTSLNQNIYIYSDRIDSLYTVFYGCSLLADKYIHIRSSIPLDTSNSMYNALVNNYTGVNWTGRVVNDLEEPTQWPPV